MNNQFDELMYEAGLTAQGCWDEMDEYNRTAIMKFAELIVKECAGIYSKIDNGNDHLDTDDYLEALHRTFFGVEE